MGGMGTSTTSQDTTQRQNMTQQSQTAPWLQAIPGLQGILGQLGVGLGNTGLTQPEQGALSNLQTNATNYGGFFAPQVSEVAQRLMAGGGATNEAGNVNANYKRYESQINPLASDLNYDPMKNPGTAGLLAQIQGDVGNNVNSMFAAAGRDFSGAHQGSLARGIAAGEAPVLFNQYNANRTAQQGAAGNLYAAGNTNAGILSGMQQQSMVNKQLGADAATKALDLQNAGANATLQAEAQRRGIPVQALGLLAQIGIPIAGLGSQNSGSGTSNTIGHTDASKTASPLEQFGQLTSGLTGLFGGIPGMSTAQSIYKMLSDSRAKQDITQVGTLFDGTPVYRYRYIGQPAFQIGLMAQDIEKVTPEAVGMIGEFKAVDYKLATDKALEAA